MSIAEGMLVALQDYVDGLEERVLKDKGLRKAIEIDEMVQSRTQQGDETLMELRRLGLIDRKGIGNVTICFLSSEGLDALSTIKRVGRQKCFFDLLYEKEPLFRQFVDMMRRRGKLSDEEALEISGINKVKISFIKSILKQLPSFAQTYREGKKSYVRYVRIEPVSSLEMRKAIVRKYSELQASSLFVEIDALWRWVQTEFPDVSEELFDQVLLDLVNQYIGRVELIQGVASPNMKLLFDKNLIHISII